MGLTLVGAQRACDPLEARLPDSKAVLARVDLPIEPRRKPSGL
ncbi:MAG TPA: hypothetical protein VHJ17_23330 [Thermomonospora sp.]|nr:hypothetical protein [Thermomonospora sp.]